MLKKKHVPYLISLSGILFLDQISKIWALNWAREVLGGIIPDLSQGILLERSFPFFNWVFVWNQGVSFGLFNNENVTAAQPYLLAGFAGLVALFLCVWFFKAQQTIQKIALMLLISGAIGNMIDRLLFGAVIDFLDFHYGGYHWPAFNVADIAICFGAALLILHGLRNEPKSPKKK